MAKTVLVTGGTGLLGKDELDVFSKTGYDLHSISRNFKANAAVKYWKGDLTDRTFVRTILNKLKPVVIVHCAAYVDLDYCELNQGAVDALHISATQELASFSPMDTRFIYISTDSVFDGRDGNYNESSLVRPLNYYSESKLAGEYAVVKNNPQALVLRTNLYGFHNPVGKSLLEWALTSFAQGKRINGFDDVFFNPLYSKQLATLILKFCQTGSQVSGIIHAGCRDPISKYMFLRKVAEYFNFEKDLVQRMSIDGLSFSVMRPKNTTLNLGGLASIIEEIPTLEAGLSCVYSDSRSIGWKKFIGKDSQTFPNEAA